MAKLADAGGLNPPSTNVEYGFKSRPGHHVAGIWLISMQLRFRPLLDHPFFAAGSMSIRWGNAAPCFDDCRRPDACRPLRYRRVCRASQTAFRLDRRSRHVICSCLRHETGDYERARSCCHAQPGFASFRMIPVDSKVGWVRTRYRDPHADRRTRQHRRGQH